MATGSPDWRGAITRAQVRPEARKYSADVPATTAHLLTSVDYDLGHAHEHVEAAQKSGTPEATAFNLDHAKGHLDSALDHAHRLTSHLRDHYPKEGAALDSVVDKMGLSRDKAAPSSDDAIPARES